MLLLARPAKLIKRGKLILRCNFSAACTSPTAVVARFPAAGLSLAILGILLEAIKTSGIPSLRARDTRVYIGEVRFYVHVYTLFGPKSFCVELLQYYQHIPMSHVVSHKLFENCWGKMHCYIVTNKITSYYKMHNKKLFHP